MKIVLMVLMSVMLVSVGVVWCTEPLVKSSPASTGTSSVEEKVLSVEVEGFSLTNADEKKVEGASGGKVVVLKDTSSKAEKTIQLSKGKYNVTVYVLAPSEDEDAFYVEVGGKGKNRVYPEAHGEIAPILNAVDFTQEADGPCTILLTFGEDNVQLDRVEFKLVPQTRLLIE